MPDGDSAAGAARLPGVEARPRQRIHPALRVVVATVCFCLGGFVTLGPGQGVARAQQASSQVRGHRTLHNPKSNVHRHAPAMKGMASWYGGSFNRRRTASGVIFNTHAIMAAHRTLPFGTKVRVTNLDNHKSCVVEITDRGPFEHGRIIDLSLAAARKIGMVHRGVAPVKLQIVGSGSSSILEDLAASEPIYDAPVRDVLNTFVVNEPAP